MTSKVKPQNITFHAVFSMLFLCYLIFVATDIDTFVWLAHIRQTRNSEGVRQLTTCSRPN